MIVYFIFFFFSSRRRHTRCALVTGVQTCALPISDGTPDELTTALEGRTVLVDAAEPRQAQKALVDVPGVLSVAQIGNSLRVLTDRNGAAAARIRGVLEEAGLQAGAHASTPNLEDVILVATGGNADDRTDAHTSGPQS